MNSQFLRVQFGPFKPVRIFSQSLIHHHVILVNSLLLIEWHQGNVSYASVKLELPSDDYLHSYSQLVEGNQTWQQKHKKHLIKFLSPSLAVKWGNELDTLQSSVFFSFFTRLFFSKTTKDQGERGGRHWIQGWLRRKSVRPSHICSGLSIRKGSTLPFAPYCKTALISRKADSGPD